MGQPAATGGFVADLVRQIRAGDAYGRYDSLGEEALLKPYILTKEERQAIPVLGDLDEATQGRLRDFYQAVCAAIERETGVMVGCLLDMSHEGFGRVILFAGRLIPVGRTLRDAHRFGFPSREKLAEEGERLVRSAVEMLRRFPEVAAL